MNKDYFVLYTPLEMNKAYFLLQKSYSYEEILSLIKDGDDIEKQIALLNISYIKSCEDALVLISALTGQHGPIREICSAKINELLCQEEYRLFFKGSYIREICLNALNDIIPTVARNILSVIKFLPDTDIVYESLLNRIIELKDYNDDNLLLDRHEIVKKTFKLYWYLEALSTFPYNPQYNNKMNEILQYTYLHEDYTIREKIAKIVSKLEGFDNFKEKLKEDSNPYVFSYIK